MTRRAAMIAARLPRSAMKAKALMLAGCVALFSLPADAQAPVPRGAAACSGCHAPARVGSPVPPVNGREPQDIVAAMQDFRSGRRAATVMDRLAKGFSDDEIQAIAAWLGAQR